jgi:hypothetical protein
MKTLFHSFKTISMVLFSIVALTLTSCGDDDTTSETLLQDAIVGTWNLTSYKVGTDEYMGLIFSTASLKFEATNGAEGEFEQTVTFPDGETASITGPYTVHNSNHKITMTYDGDVVIAEIEIKNGKMTWDGTQDGYPLLIKADKQ